jgi:predicted DNA-binding transcriptional regulator AlpA
MSTVTAGSVEDLDTLLDRLPDLLTREELLSLLRVSRMTLFDWMRYRHFPRPLPLSSSACRWTRESVRRWLHEAAHGPQPTGRLCGRPRRDTPAGGRRERR